jgi:hypothetical protein
VRSGEGDGITPASVKEGDVRANQSENYITTLVFVVITKRSLTQTKSKL